MFLEGDTLSIHDDDQNWLSVYHEPWDTVRIKWKATCSIRSGQIKKAGRNITNIVEVWPKYTNSKGAQLVNS